MASEAKTAGMKQLKVDNWGTFFMQRLQLLFAKGDSCDLTLKFVTGQELKVHSLVLRTCTSHFDSLPKVDNTISLPESLSYNAVFPIINFMYSGKLEFKPELHAQLLAVVKILNITILSKLFTTAQKSDAPVPSCSKSKPVTSSQDINLKTPTQVVLQQTAASSSTPNLFSSKKLPFWRKRTLPFLKYRKPIEEEPGPTRFFWPENESPDLISLSSPSFAGLSYESDPIIKGLLKKEEDDEDKGSERTIVPQRRVIESRLLTTHDSDDDDDHFEATYSSDEEPEPPTPRAPTPPQSSTLTLKPCLKTPPPPVAETNMPPTPQISPPPPKKVRFSLGPEGKENTGQKTSNHARIIAEVLKKYPDLVKNKNIKLKISSPRPKVENGAVSGEGKASYVVLRPTLKPTPNTSTKQNDITGPWTCEHCSDLKFEDYLSFRRHLQEIHNERLDARICEYCGYKASKRNLHLYHLFTKHNVPPPKNIKFPKCTECEYIALSESLLMKHANSHQIRCDVCKTSMKTQAALQAHKVTCKPGCEPRNIICDLCKRAFRTNVSLNAHLKECQGKAEVSSNIFGDENEQQPVEMIEVPIIETVDVQKNNRALVQIPSGIILTENDNMATLLPSSESEGLNNVATGIATSIGLTVALPQEQQTVILLEGNPEFFLQGNDSIVVHKHPEEYIVPELLESSFTSGGNVAYAGSDQIIYLGSSTSTTHREVIHLEEIKLNQPRPGPSSEEGKVIVEQEINEENCPELSEDDDKDVMVGQDESAVVDDQLVSHKDAQNNIVVVNDEPKSSSSSSIDYVKKCHSKESVSVLDNMKDGVHQLDFENVNNNSSKKIISSSNSIEIMTETPDMVCNVHNGKTIVEVEGTNENTLASSDHVSSNISSLEESEVKSTNEKQTHSSNFNEGVILITEETCKDNRIEQLRVPPESMQIDEVREEIMVIDNKDEEMEVGENLDNEGTKDSMDIDEPGKTGDEKVDSLVKDWGFDDEDTEEVIDDPDCKPLRPEIDIPL